MRRARLALLVLALPLAAQPSLPLLEKIYVDAPPASLQTTVRGAAQAVPASAHVVAVNTQSGHYVIAQAAADGSFAFPIYAAPGDSILVKSDPTGVQAERLRRFNGVIDQAMSELTSLHGTIVRAPEGLASPNAFVDSGTSDSFLPYWTMQGTVDRLAVSPGGSLTVDAALSVHTTAAGANPGVGVTGSLIMLSRADGTPALDQNTYASALMTPTGLPIERAFGTTPWVPSVTNEPLRAEGDRMRATFRTTIAAAADLPAGYYRPVLQFRLNGITGAKPQNIPVTTFLGNASRRLHSAAYLPIVKVGDPGPPRLGWTLLANTLAEGMRGLNAIEDRGRFSIVPRVTTASDRFVVPRGTYNIEPFALTIGLADRGAPINPPLIPFRFPSGGLTATVRRPDGSTATIGPVPFKQIALVGPANRNGDPMENGGHITDPVRLTTRDARFDFAFDQEGRYTIALDGTIEDVWGNVWSSRGTYELDVATPLLIESTTIPGTPFETGNSLARGVRLVPPVPAEVEIRVRFAPRSNAAATIDETIVTRANRFGYVPIRPFRFAEPGEYRVDVFASHRDATGKLWAGTQTFASAVADRSPGIVAHGLRGVDDQHENRPQWFSRLQMGTAPGRGHVPFAFLSGDVTWLQDDDAAIPWINIQDVDGTLAPLLRPAYQCAMPAPQYDALAALGEIPLKSCGRHDPHIDPANAAVWGYSYRSVQRPHVRVREEISDDNSPAPYWRFNDLYGLQSGNGMRGDLPNDFKFQFGAAVLRGNALPAPRYAIYGSLFVLVPMNDPLTTRTFPPFQGNGGGPSGGPLFTLKGKEIDLFFHPMGVRPGTILVVGEVASFAGYSAPPLASKVEIAVTSPSGKTRTIRGQANRVGWFYDPSKDFVLSEAGLWRAKITITFDGITSAGPVSAPFPSGDVLGTHEGELAFYVVDANAEPLALAPLPPNASSPVTFTMLPPAGLANIETHHTVTMPGFVLEEGSGLAYTYDRSALANDFPNLEEVDIVTVSLYLSGTDASGKRRHFSRKIVLNGETLHAPEQIPPQPKRRAVR